jgi:prepilin-type N-terminal cleavage/methylation domain-containing protein
MIPPSRFRLAGFTLVELLTVVAIVGVLVALLLPAVQSARESARRVACGNNVRQLALGCLQHLDQQGFFPSGGWGWCWTGDPDRGFGRSQPGSWAYSILPAIELGPLHALAGDGDPATVTAQRTEVRAAHVRDGMSSTYLIGEKCLNPDNYATGLDICDDHSLFAGDDLDMFG